jgi:hypothetical protein
MKQRQLQLQRSASPPANQRRPPSEGKRYHRWLFCGERNSGVSCRGIRKCPASKSNLSGSLALALKGSRHCAPHSYYRSLFSAGRSSQQPPGLFTRWLLPGYGTGLEGHDGAVSRREDGLRSRDRPLATDRDASG